MALKVNVFLQAIVFSTLILLKSFLFVVGSKYLPTAQYTAPDFRSLSLAFGTILFAFGGACTFPTFQNDMREKRKFSKAVYLGFGALMIIYIPIAAGGYALFGKNAQENILNNVDRSIFHTLINILMAFHLFCAYLIVINPLNQDLEKRFKISHCNKISECFLSF